MKLLLWASHFFFADGMLIHVSSYVFTGWQFHTSDHHLMKLCDSSLLFWLVIIVILLPLALGDSNGDEQTLLAFAAQVPHQRMLNWTVGMPMCNWTGVACYKNSNRVFALRLPGIGLVGPLPENTLGKLDALVVLSLRSNLLGGNLPSDISSLPSLRFLFLQHNNLSGNIPTSFSHQLTVLDLSFNSFTGNIPQSFQNLTELTTLYLQNNSLNGAIPNITLPKLRHLNLSDNHLNGSIPPSLQKFPNASFTGNIQLCGLPLGPCFPVRPPPPSPMISPPPPEAKQHSQRKLPLAAIIGIAVGGALLLLLALVIFLACCLKKKQSDGGSVLKGKSSTGGRSEKPREEFGSGVQEPEKNKLVFFEGSSYNFDLEDLLRASAEVLGKGSFGTAYKAVLEESTTVVVKRLKEVIVGKKDFEQQMEIIGRVGQHPNVVPLRAYYYSKDEKLLVYDYFSNSSLSSLLHGMLVSVTQF